MPATHETSRHAAPGSLWRWWIRAPSWAAARWPPVLWEPGDSASQCHGVLNISEISPPSILWQQPAVTCDSFYLHSALHCTPFCNAIRVPQFGLDNLINTKFSKKGIGKLCLRNYIWIIVCKTFADRQLALIYLYRFLKCASTTGSLKRIVGK